MTMVQTFSAGGNILTQGFQQPNDILIGIIEASKDEFGSFGLYPNPAVDNLWFGFELPESGRVSVGVFNGLGQKIADVYEGNYTAGTVTQQIGVSNLAAGMYFLQLTFVSGRDGKSHISSKKFQVIN
jgi:hypothetical protein